MQISNIIIGFSVATLLAVSSMSQAGRFQSNDFNGYGNNASSASSSTEMSQLSSEEIDSLLFMREEEKLARDVYLTLYEQWNNPVFKNIARSEQKHMDAMVSLLNKFQLNDPVVDDSTGAFVNPELAAMYEEFVEKGRHSEMDALYVGGLIEEVDMEDIQKGIDSTNNRMIKRVYGSLLKGSRNHLRAFVRQIESRGVTYEPQQLDAEELYEVVDSPMERGS
ncbi:MAG: Unknown protein [uncultured Thiotrichaceae bacterium]|uniref:DUF2202 domain-containing protein n=1 Tax=uncultured Thiotrichaceae bacterium TaxID=298394 RepID=A0A6S6UAN3_9GAMM|nr:MAG: Unknown protein [uncultured Thiotrichaceae bacterium]